MKSDVEKMYNGMVVSFIKKHKTTLRQKDARKVLEESLYPMYQEDFVLWAWDLFRVTREPAIEMYLKVTGEEDDNE